MLAGEASIPIGVAFQPYMAHKLTGPFYASEAAIKRAEAALVEPMLLFKFGSPPDNNGWNISHAR
jgi:hypothetical protein